jgi:hypothetical protein
MNRRSKWIAALAALASWPLSAQAQQRIEIFDAHLHYNQEPKPFYSLDQVRDIFRRNGHHRHRRDQPAQQRHA